MDDVGADKRSGIRLFLSRLDAEASNVEIAVVPDRNSGDDFGYRTQADIGLNCGGEWRWFRGKFTIESVKDLLSFVKSEFLESGVHCGLDIVSLNRGYASLLEDARSYATLGRVLGKSAAKSCLSLLHDAAFYMRDGAIPGWSNFYESEVYSNSLVRSSDGYYAVRRGRLMLENGGVDSVELRHPFSVRLSGGGPDVDFVFRFDEGKALRGRLSVLVGENGCGKTSSISRIARGLADSKAKGVVFENRPTVNQVVAFAHSSSARSFVVANQTAGSARVKFYDLDPGGVGGKRGAGSDVRLLVDVAKSDDIEGSSLRFFKATMAREFDKLSIRVPIRHIALSKYESAQDGYVCLSKWGGENERHRLDALTDVDCSRPLKYASCEGTARLPSLGQLAFIRFTLKVLASAGPSSFLIVDEPESFLHPNLVSAFIRVICKILEHTDSLAIVATHSPFIVREVQSAQVHVMRILEGRVSVASPRMQTLGANVASISSEVFGDDLIKHLHEEVLAGICEKIPSFEAALDSLKGELSIDAMMQLRRKMEV